ncbi:hypothetical protein H4Q26_010485 [Puccinia striiformis f. sp. tritici PST-130]|nr:hypothetical protein H4Q26_010485 [Puccinia striiformis f. sp. tritici PST-130]
MNIGFFGLGSLIMLLGIFTEGVISKSKVKKIPNCLKKKTDAEYNACVTQYYPLCKGMTRDKFGLCCKGSGYEDQFADRASKSTYIHGTHGEVLSAPGTEVRTQRPSLISYPFRPGPTIPRMGTSKVLCNPFPPMVHDFETINRNAALMLVPGISVAIVPSLKLKLFNWSTCRCRKHAYDGMSSSSIKRIHELDHTCPAYLSTKIVCGTSWIALSRPSNLKYHF